jgi:hypothetical protein
MIMMICRHAILFSAKRSRETVHKRCMCFTKSYQLLIVVDVEDENEIQVYTVWLWHVKEYT